jgi:hypothetical protein
MIPMEHDMNQIYVGEDLTRCSTVVAIYTCITSFNTKDTAFSGGVYRIRQIVAVNSNYSPTANQLIFEDKMFPLR